MAMAMTMTETATVTKKYIIDDRQSNDSDDEENNDGMSNIGNNRNGDYTVTTKMKQ